MRYTRQIITVAVIAIYLAQAVAGQAVHLWQCATGCCEHQAVQSAADDTHHGHTCCSHSHSDDVQQQSRAIDCNKSNDAPAGDQHGHDSSTCSVCQVLAQAQETPQEFSIQPAGRLVQMQAEFFPAFYPAATPRRFRTRAPPQV